jgi:uncharacterized membrane protein
MKERLMMTLVFDFASLVLAALLVGAMFAVCLLFNPAGVDAPTYVTHQQWGIRTLHPIMPPLGGLTVLAIVGAAFLSRGDRSQLTLLLFAGGLFLVAGLITRLLNMPINSVVMTWSPQAPPADWVQLRDAWWRWHILRFSAGAAGLALLIFAALLPVTAGGRQY